jgi:hypothetical protein
MGASKLVSRQPHVVRDQREGHQPVRKVAVADGGGNGPTDDNLKPPESPNQRATAAVFVLLIGRRDQTFLSAASRSRIERGQVPIARHSF